MKKLSALALVAAGLAIAPTPSLAAPVITTDASGGTYGNNDPDAGVGGVAHFQDIYTFVLPFARSVTIDLFSVSNNFPRDNVNFVTSATKVDNTKFTNISVGNPEIKTFSGILGAGTHTIQITGSSGPTGAYSGTLVFASVPEPSVWAMFILGFGAVGFFLRRRKKVNLAVSYA